MAITNPGIEDGFDLDSNNLLALGTLVDDGYATNEIPKSGNINTVFKDLYRYMQHLKDTGISQWDNTTSYEKFSRIMRNGIIYQSLSDANQGNDPLSTLNTFWGYTVSQISGYKNILINGDKRVNQRVYADGVLADGVYGYDRWKGADTDVNIEQIIEQQNIITGTYTISWVGGGTATVDGNAGLASGDSVAITVASDISVKVPKASTDIQLEHGSAATAFEQRPIGLELSLCQRYFEKSYNQGVDIGEITNDGGLAITDSNSTPNRSMQLSVGYKISKRSTPTITVYSPSLGTSGKSDGNSVSGVSGIVSRSGENSFAWLQNGATNQASVKLHFIADAEL